MPALTVFVLAFCLGITVFLENHGGRMMAVILCSIMVSLVTLVCLWVRRKSTWNITLTIAGLFLISALISTVASVDRYLSAIEFLRWSSLFFLYYLAIQLGHDKQTRKQLLFLLVTIALVIVVPSLLFLLWDFGAVTVGKRLIGSLLWYNHMANFILLTAPLSLALGFMETGKRKIFFLIISLFFILALTFTYSRAAWLSALFGVTFLSFYLLFNRGRGRSKTSKRYDLKWAAGIMAVTCILLIILFSHPLFKARLASIPGELFPSSRTTSGELRLEASRVSLMIFQNHPWLGMGTGVYGLVYGAYQRKPWLYAHDAHNIFLQILAEQGLGGLVFFSLFLISLAYFMLGRTHPLSILAAAIASALGMAIIHNLFDTSLLQLTPANFFFVEAGMLSAIAVPKKSNTTSSPQRLAFLAFFILLISIFFLYHEKRYQIALALGKSKDFNTAINVIRSLNHSFPWRNDYYRLLGSLFWLKNDPQQAEVNYRKAVILNPYVSENYLRLAEVLAVAGNRHEAMEVLNKGIKIKPYNQIVPYIALAQLYLKDDEVNKARELLQTATTRFPLNRAYSDRYHDYQIVGFDKELRQAYELYAEVLTKSGRESEAKAIQEQAVQMTKMY